MTALDAFGDRHLAFARQQRHDSHFTQIETDRIVGLLERARGKIELDVFVEDLFVFVRDCCGRLLEQAFVGIGDGDVRAFQFLKDVFNVVGRNDIVGQLAVEIVER